MGSGQPATCDGCGRRAHPLELVRVGSSRLLFHRGVCADRELRYQAEDERTAAVDQVDLQRWVTATVTAQNGIAVPETRLNDTMSSTAPRANLFRALWAPPELRETGADGPVLHGHFAVWDQWAEIDSAVEGRFLERLHPRSMDRTFMENRASMKVLFQHGKDPQIGSKPLGPIRKLRAEPGGAYYEVGLLPTQYNAELLPGLQAGLYGASFRFSLPAGGDRWVQRPGKSVHNPEGLPERTLTDIDLFEFGPVTWPAYAKATAKIRSVTDEFTPGSNRLLAGSSR